MGLGSAAALICRWVGVAVSLQGPRHRRPGHGREGARGQAGDHLVRLVGSGRPAGGPVAPDEPHQQGKAQREPDGRRRERLGGGQGGGIGLGRPARAHQHHEVVHEVDQDARPQRPCGQVEQRGDEREHAGTHRIDVERGEEHRREADADRQVPPHGPSLEQHPAEHRLLDQGRQDRQAEEGHKQVALADAGQRVVQRREEVVGDRGRGDGEDELGHQQPRDQPPTGAQPGPGEHGPQVHACAAGHHHQHPGDDDQVGQDPEEVLGDLGVEHGGDGVSGHSDRDPAHDRPDHQPSGAHVAEGPRPGSGRRGRARRRQGAHGHVSSVLNRGSQRNPIPPRAQTQTRRRLPLPARGDSSTGQSSGLITRQVPGSNPGRPTQGQPGHCPGWPLVGRPSDSEGARVTGPTVPGRPTNDRPGRGRARGPDHRGVRATHVQWVSARRRGTPAPSSGPAGSAAAQTPPARGPRWARGPGRRTGTCRARRPAGTRRGSRWTPRPG